MSIGSLNTALSGLKAAQAALNVTSNNIANASTPGYTRKILPQEALITSTGEGLGVNLNTIRRNVDITLLKTVLTQNGETSGLETRENYLSKISDFNGSSNAEIAISSEISHLADEFSIFASSPSDTLSINSVLNQAEQTASKINDFAGILSQLRNDTQNDLSISVNEVNSLLESISQFNGDINKLAASNISTANIEDQRDQALDKLSEYMKISFFSRDNGKITVLASNGQVLADDNARQISFNAGRLLPTSFYPGGGAEGLFIDATPPIDITSSSTGGKIGALIELRDTTIPQYTAQLDELAQKLASRLDGQGLRLFTDVNGNVPADIADPAIVDYVGFSSEIRVNSAILNDPSLLRTGTTGASVADGSSEIIRKVVEFAFGQFQHEQAIGTTDISAGTIFTAAGLSQRAQAVGTIDITDLTTLDTDPNIIAGTQFNIDVGTGSTAIAINLGDTATDLINQINAATGTTAARLNTLGQIVLEAPNDIIVSDTSIGSAGIQALGLNFTTYAGKNPDFTIQIGSENPLTITISPTDTATNLLATLNAIPNITAVLNGSGGLEITPTEGGDITLSDGFGSPLFGLGVTTIGVEHSAFRQNNLGPDGSISTELLSTISLEDFARAIISFQGEDFAHTARRAEIETTFLNTLKENQASQSGVDLDQEISELIRLQTAYTASARLITTAERMLDELFNAIR